MNAERVGRDAHNFLIGSNDSAPRSRLSSPGVGTIAFRLRPDVRHFSDGGDRLARCRKCGTRIVLLPDDRRQGFCFDCYDTLEVTVAAV